MAGKLLSGLKTSLVDYQKAVAKTMAVIRL